MPEDHQARIVWDYVNSLDLSPLYERIKAVERHAGQSAIDPRILFALWLYATLRGIGSARELDRRCDPQRGEVPFQWICGGVSVNYHTLADFRTGHVELLEQTLTTSVAVLMQEGLVTLDRVAQDGMKVRASAGAASVSAIGSSSVGLGYPASGSGPRTGLGGHGPGRRKASDVGLPSNGLGISRSWDRATLGDKWPWTCLRF